MTLQHSVIGTTATIRGVREVAPAPDEVLASRRAQVLGAPDPYSLIVHDEVVALTGLPVGGPYLSWTDEDIGVRFVAEDGRGRAWSFAVHAGHAADARAGFDPAGWYRWMVAMLDDPEPVPGLGQAAAYRDGLLYVLGRGFAFYVLVEAPDGSPLRRWTGAIARRVSERFVAGLVH